MAKTHLKPKPAQRKQAEAPTANQGKIQATDEHGIATYPDVFRQFEHAMLDMERRMDRLVKEAFEEGEGWGDLSLFHGLSLQPGPGGRVRFQPFGNLGQTLKALREGWREPFVTWSVDDAAGVVRLRAETPGIKKEELSLEVADDTVFLEATGKANKYRARCTPGVALDPARVEARYEDGILEATIHVKPAGESRGHKIKIA